MTQLAQEHGAINLSQGFPDFDVDPALIDAVAGHMRAGHNQYAPMAGVPVLRAAIADKISAVYGRRYDPDLEITVTSGATEGLFATLTSLVHPGDEVLLFEPVYDSYVPAVLLSGGIPRFVSLRAPDYAVDWDQVRRAVSPRTRAIIVNTPHNPTGMIWTADDMRQLARLLEHTNAVVIADEVYEHILFDGARHESVCRYEAIAERAVVISSFGKTFHTTGWKVGYCSAPAWLSAAIRQVHQWIVFAVNGAVQMAYAEFLARDPACASVTAFYQRKRDRFRELLAASKFTPLPCRGTFFQLLDYSAITGMADEEFARVLTRDHGVAAIPVSPLFHQAGQRAPVLRFCFAKRDVTLEQAAKRLCAV